MSENQPPPYPGDPSGQQPDDQPGPTGSTGSGEPQDAPQQPYGAQPPPQQPWGAQPPPQQPYAGQQPYGAAPGQWQVLPKHPKATLVLVLGILGLVVCQVLGPFAWVMGNRAVAEIDANPGVWDGRGEAQAGRILGIISTVILILSVLVLAFVFVLAIAGIMSASNDFDEMSNELSLLGLL